MLSKQGILKLISYDFSDQPILRKLTTLLAGAVGIIVCTHCATYNYATSIKTVSFSGDLHKGTSVGTLHGEDCIWQILGIKFGGDPSMARAIANSTIETESDEKLAAPLATQNKTLRYLNGVQTQAKGFNAVVFAKNCIVVTGEALK